MPPLCHFTFRAETSHLIYRVPLFATNPFGDFKVKLDTPHNILPRTPPILGSLENRVARRESCFNHLCCNTFHISLNTTYP